MSLGNPLILGPHETKLIIPPFKIYGKEFQIVASYRQILGVLTSVSWRQNGEFGVQIHNTTGESKLLSQKLSVVVVMVSSDSTIEVNKSVRKQVSAHVNSISLKNRTTKYPGLFEDEVMGTMIF